MTAAPPAGSTPLSSPAGLPARFVLHRRIGSGSAGTVYAAHDHEREIDVALKIVLLAESGVDLGGALAADLQRRFVAEAAIAQRLIHPDIVRTFDAGSDGRIGWLSMEGLPAAALSRYTVTPRLLPDRLVVHAAERIADALAHAHGQGVVHRDLKPSNVLVNWSLGVCKLGDFGLARDDRGQATRTGLVLGSPAFMAPELLRGDPATPRSDLYALGVMLYQLLSGRLPHDDASLGELLRRVMHEPAPPLRQLQPTLPVALTDLVGRLLALRANDRSATAEGVASELRAIRHTMAGGD